MGLLLQHFNESHSIRLTALAKVNMIAACSCCHYARCFFWYLIPNTDTGRLQPLFFLTCIRLSRRLFRVTLEISRAECNIDVTPGTLTATNMCIGYHVSRFEASWKVILHTRYVSTCIGAGGGRGRKTKIKTKANRCGACYYSIMLDAQRVTSMADILTCDRCKSSLRHIHVPVLLSLKMKGICLLFFLLWRCDPVRV
jgi:hypothetical protein